MKKISSENLNYLLMGVVVTLLIALVLVLIIMKPFSRLQNASSDRPSSSHTEEKTPAPTDQDEPVTPTPEETPVPTPVVTPPPVVTTPSTPTPNPIPEEKGSEEMLIQYFDGEVNEIENHSSDVSFVEKAKTTFHNIVDFIFYGKEIKGYTFSELTTQAKLKIISLALKLDNKIDQYFPNYKEKIKESYVNIKGKLAAFYLELTQSLCESVGEVTCNQAKQDFQSMKESFGFTWELLKELGSKGKEKILEFYWNLRDGN